LSFVNRFGLLLLMGPWRCWGRRRPCVVDAGSSPSAAGWVSALALPIGLSVAVAATGQARHLAGSGIGIPVRQSGQSPSSPRSAGDSTAKRASAVPARWVYDHGDPTVDEQFMLELVNRSRADPLAEARRLGIDLNQGLVFGTISADPKPPLAFQPELIDAARTHSDWMLDQDVFSHDGVNGTTPGDRMRRAGYLFSGSWSWGENIAWMGSTGAIPTAQAVAAEHDSLFRSPGHRVNLCGDFDEVGIGARTGIFTRNGTGLQAVMTTQNFARSESTPGPLLVGVVYRDADGDGAYSPGEGLPGVTVIPDSGGYLAFTSSSGGYAVPVPAVGVPVEVTIRGPGLSTPQSRTVTPDPVNLKLDFVIADLTDPVPVDLMVGRFDPLGRFTFEVHGPIGARVQALQSADLATWSILATVTLDEGRATLTDSGAGPGRRFYRAVIVR